VDTKISREKYYLNLCVKRSPKEEGGVFPGTLVTIYMTTWYPEPDNHNMNLLCGENLLSATQNYWVSF
jgi:hypothetical protein